jgi:Zn-dependent protease with chaperone function
VRSLILILALLAGCAATVAPLVIGFAGLWSLGHLGSHSTLWMEWSAFWVQSIGDPLPRLPSAPAWSDWAWWTVALSVSVGAVAGAAHVTVPLGRRVLDAHPGAFRVRKRHAKLRPLIEEVDELAGQLRIKAPAVWVTGERGIQGGAWAAPGRAAVTISQGALQLPPDERRWLIAHELAHIGAGDSLVKGLWLVMLEGVNLLRGARTALLQIGLWLANAIPLLGHLMAIVLVTAGWILRATDTLVRGGFKIVQLIDRWFERNAERHADETARRLCGGNAGARLLQRLGGASPFESINPFRSHPTIEQRVDDQMAGDRGAR